MEMANDKTNSRGRITISMFLPRDLPFVPPAVDSSLITREAIRVSTLAAPRETINPPTELLTMVLTAVVIVEITIAPPIQSYSDYTTVCLHRFNRPDSEKGEVAMNFQARRAKG
jgi:hypothetical protein